MNEILKFLLVAFSILSGLLLISLLFETHFCKGRVRLSSAKYLCTVAVCAALASILMILEFPLPFLVPSFYKLDASELPVMICGFYLGPTAGIIAEFLKILLKLLIKGSSSAFVGELANFVVGCSFVLPATMIYHARKQKKNAIVGLCTGTVVMSAFGSLFNAVYLLPAFSELFHMSIDQIIAAGNAINSSIHSVMTFVFFAVFPLNLIKGILISMLTMLLYKQTERILFKRS